MGHGSQDLERQVQRSSDYHRRGAFELLEPHARRQGEVPPISSTSRSRLGPQARQQGSIWQAKQEEVAEEEEGHQGGMGCQAGQTSGPTQRTIKSFLFQFYFFLHIIKINHVD